MLSRNRHFHGLLLVTLITTKGVNSVTSLVLVTVALLSFLICLICVLTIFDKNAAHLDDIINSNAKSDPLLGVLDKISITSFIVAVILSCILGVSTAAESLKEKEKKMSDDKKQAANQVQPIRESFNGAANLRPNIEDMTKSFNGAANLRPSIQSTDNAQQTINQQPQNSSDDKK